MNRFSNVKCFSANQRLLRSMEFLGACACSGVRPSCDIIFENLDAPLSFSEDECCVTTKNLLL
ncbi:hypothetical protein EDS67_17545 [candidate division KSB1 bacterium]|nr:MAG: hypothetical protein EDS67_17545 [candidate division KSB1 bacterium]MBC6946442.1 hypothetical protein [candidate division KSB1 bacterium]MCE7942371.1 hypothetical protein [Chlorobi bacterium CHB1]